jgi:energy-coupling factor transport system permease protein
LPGLDPRTKLTLGLAAIVAVFIAHSAKTLIAEGLILLILILLMGLRRAWIHSFRPVLPLVGLIFVISFISFGAWIAFLLSLRLYILLTVSFVFFRSVSPEEIGRGLEEMGISYGVVFILMTAMRYVPIIGSKIRNIIDAQQSRGIDLRPKIKNTLNFMALLMPLLVQAFLLSDELAMAMEARGFGRKGRSSRKAYCLTVLDWVLIALSPTFLFIFYWWERH